MKHLLFPGVLLSLGLILIAMNCEDDTINPSCLNPASSAFEIKYTNNGQAPDQVELLSQAADGFFEWFVESKVSRSTLKDITVNFEEDETGDYDATLTVTQDESECIRTQVISIRNHPVTGTSAYYSTGGGGLNFQNASQEENPSQEVWKHKTGETVNGIAYDEENQQLYFSGSIYKGNPNGTSVSRIVDLDPTYDLEVDPADDRLFFSAIDQSGAAIYSADLMAIEHFPIYEGDKLIEFLTLDRDNNHIYFTHSEFVEAVWRIDYSGKAVDGFAFGDLGATGRKNALVFDNIHKMLYYAEGAQDNFIKRVGLPVTPNSVGEVVVDFASALPVLGLDIDEKEEVLYWIDQAEGTLKKFEINGLRKPVVVKEGLVDPKALEIYNAE